MKNSNSTENRNIENQENIMALIVYISIVSIYLYILNNYTFIIPKWALIMIFILGVNVVLVSGKKALKKITILTFISGLLGLAMGIGCILKECGSGKDGALIMSIGIFIIYILIGSFDNLVDLFSKKSLANF